MRPFSILAISGLATLVAMPGLALAQGNGATKVDRVQLAVVDSGGAVCPRDATLTAWAHTSGPGVVRFVIHNGGGGKTGELQADAVRGAAGTYLATYNHTFKVTTDVDTKYMAEVPGSGQESNWVPFKASCGPQARAGTSATGSAAQPPARTAQPPAREAPESRARESMGDPTASGGLPPATNTPPAKPASAPKPNSDGKPGGTSKPNPSSKPNSSDGKQCGRQISSTRALAVTKVLGSETALIGWMAVVGKEYPNSWAKWDNAKNRSLNCERAGPLKLTFNCTVSARPCEP